MSKELHDQVMNIPCRRADDSFLNTESRLLYKEGHRDARHDAAELAIGYVAAPSAANGAEMPELPEPFMELHKDLGPTVYNAWAKQMQAYARAAVLAEREACAVIAASCYVKDQFRFELGVQAANIIRSRVDLKAEK